MREQYHQGAFVTPYPRWSLKYEPHVCWSQVFLSLRYNYMKRCSIPTRGTTALIGPTRNQPRLPALDLPRDISMSEQLKSTPLEANARTPDSYFIWWDQNFPGLLFFGWILSGLTGDKSREVSFIIRFSSSDPILFKKGFINILPLSNRYFRRLCR